MRFSLVTGCIVLLLSATVRCGAQQAGGDVWGNAGKSAKGIKEKGAKKVAGIRKWKDHLKEWGTDTAYDHSLSLSGRLNSDGWAGGFTYKHRRGGGSYGTWQLRFAEIKHEKEIKQQRDNTAFPALGAGSAYIFGKINNLYTLQLGYGRERTLLPAVLEGNVSVGLRYGGGFSLAMLKPYYLDLLNIDYSAAPATATVEAAPYSDASSTRFLNPATILGKGRWKDGLNNLSYVPGVYCEAALVIEPGKKKGFVQTITLGISGAVYSKALPVMATQKANAFEGCLFASLELGKRWK